MMRKYIAVLVGMALGISLVVAGCNEGENNPVSPSDSTNLFTGTFQWEGMSSSTGASLTSTFTLIQHDSLITGNLVFTGITSCCTASCTASLTGTTNGTSAVLSLETCEDTCQGNNCGSYQVGPIGGNFNVDLVEDNGILRFDRTLSDHTRIS
jgi:hypothetical protein